MIKVFKINLENINTRIDRWLKRSFSSLNQSFIEKNLRKGFIKVNQNIISSNYRLQQNDRISIFNYSDESYKNLIKENIKKNIKKTIYNQFISSIISFIWSSESSRPQ